MAAAVYDATVTDQMKLTNVGRASLADELLPAYGSFLAQKGLRVWPKESRQALVET